MGEFKGSWQLWKTLKNHWFLECFEASEGPGGALEGPCGLAGDLGASPRPWGRLLMDRFGVLEGVGKLKVRILGGVVITWGGPWGAFGRPGGGPKSYE